MLVYRVQNNEGRGPYAGSWMFTDDIQELQGNHPMPETDSGLRESIRAMPKAWKELPPKRALYCFSSLAQLRRWFYRDEWIYRIWDKDGGVAVYDVPVSAVALGRTQCVFDSGSATLVRYCTLEEVLVCGYS